jgi:hypothetical protein
MANRWFNQWLWSLEKNPAQLWGYVTFGSSGAPTLDGINSKGIKSIVRNSTGNYTVTFGVSGGNAVTDTYNALYFASRRFLSSSAPVAPHMYVVSQAVQTDGTVVVQFTDDDGSTAEDPASGEKVYLQFRVKTSTAK